VTIAGELRLPRAGSERFPLVILLHGSCGPCGLVLDWEQEFLSMGVATLVIDSFTSRDIVNTNNGQSQLGRLAQTEDAYRALPWGRLLPCSDADTLATSALVAQPSAAD
jgi:hypothetical protein